LVDSIQLHLSSAHKAEDVTLPEYQERFPEAPLFSDEAIALIRRKEGERRVAMSTQANVVTLSTAPTTEMLHERFGLGNIRSAMSSSGNGIPIQVMGSHDFEDMIPERDSNYVIIVDLLKDIMMGIELNIPVYVWGHAGTGKTTIINQIAHYTRRPVMRVQHTANMTESDVTGQWKVVNGETIFEPGPLALAMKHGWLYLADEYDFAYPSVLSVYQPVLEGQPLLIKEADAANRLVRPHQNFRFVATGNTNGSGDEHGLYSGTNIQNAANYSRFGITKEVRYMDQEPEVLMVRQQAKVLEEDAQELVKWANKIRTQFEGGEISSTVGPRELIHAAKIGALRDDFRLGIELAITNRWTPIDRESANSLAQRHF